MTQNDAIHRQARGLKIGSLLRGISAQSGMGVNGKAGFLCCNDRSIKNLLFRFGHHIFAGADFTDHAGLHAAVDTVTDLIDHPIGHFLHRLTVNALRQEGLFIKTGGMDNGNTGFLFNILDIVGITTHAVIGYVHDSADTIFIKLFEFFYSFGIAIQLAVRILLHTGQVNGDMLMHQSVTVHCLLLLSGWLCHLSIFAQEKEGIREDPLLAFKGNYMVK